MFVLRIACDFIVVDCILVGAWFRGWMVCLGLDEVWFGCIGLRLFGNFGVLLFEFVWGCVFLVCDTVLVILGLSGFGFWTACLADLLALV